LIQFETKHYIFNYHKSSLAETDIHEIAACQEACWSYICAVLKTEPSFKIEYTLCNTPEEVGRIYGDDEPCNAFARYPDKVIAVYNDSVKCIGFHEDAHCISYTRFRPESPAVREGLAMYFDRVWWGIPNLSWVGHYLKSGRYISIDELMDRDTFFSIDCSVSYPIMGAFTDYLIATYGIDAYLDFYEHTDAHQAFTDVFQKSSEELNAEFVSYARLFRIDSALECRMEELLK